MRFLLYFAACGLSCGLGLAQTFAPPARQAGHAQTKGADTLRGCLLGSADELYIEGAGGYPYLLTGEVAGLSKYWGKNIVVQGTKEEDAKARPSFHVTSVREILDRPDAKLSAAFSNPSNWRTVNNQAYGIQFAYPASLPNTAASDSDLASNLVAPDSAVVIGAFKLPGDIYNRTNFARGGLAWSVNPKVANRESCEKFGASDTNFPISAQTFAGIAYLKMIRNEEDNGTGYSFHYLHTFQNGMCYELALEFIEFNTGAMDSSSCTIPELADADRLKLLASFADRVSFFAPSVRSAAGDSAGDKEAAPRVTSIAASAATAGDMANRDPIKISWSAQDADYMELTYRCSDSNLKTGEVIILEGGNDRFCTNSPEFKDLSTDHYNRSATSSIDVFFVNHRTETISITVTAIPFSHARLYPAASKSLTITVHPQN